MVNSNPSRLNFPLWGVKIWSAQICLYLSFYLYEGGIWILVSSNLSKPNFPFKWGRVWTLVNSNLSKSNFSFIWESGVWGSKLWSTQICIDLICPLYGGWSLRVQTLVNSNLSRSSFPFIWGEGLNFGQLKSI